MSRANQVFLGNWLNIDDIFSGSFVGMMAWFDDFQIVQAMAHDRTWSDMPGNGFQSQILLI